MKSPHENATLEELEKQYQEVVNTNNPTLLLIKAHIYLQISLTADELASALVFRRS